eukprot:3610399-Amphidinium_carterae.2
MRGYQLDVESLASWSSVTAVSLKEGLPSATVHCRKNHSSTSHDCQKCLVIEDRRILSEMSVVPLLRIVNSDSAVAKTIAQANDQDFSKEVKPGVQVCIPIVCEVIDCSMLSICAPGHVHACRITKYHPHKLTPTPRVLGKLSLPCTSAHARALYNVYISVLQ